ncbi:MAG: non-heme iron oxygenase ferredoxin subunit [Myxococcota bacterium]
MSRAVRLCDTAALVDGEAIRIDVEGHRIAVACVGDSVHAIGDRCSHANFSLAEGELDTTDLTLECPKHYSRFSLTTGEPDALPAFKPVPVYAVRVDGDDVIVDLPEDDQ